MSPQPHSENTEGKADQTLRKVVGDRIAAWGLSDRAEFAEFVNA